MEKINGSEPFFFNKNSDIGVLIIHGFTSTTSSVYPLGKYLAKAGFNIECPCLSGHGTKWQDLNKVSYTEWINDVEDALERLKKRATHIFIAGLSMGGTLALFLSENHPELKGIILINHGLFIKDIRRYFLFFGRFLIKSTPPIASDIKAPDVKEIAYNRTPTNGVYEMLKLFKLVKRNLSKVHHPTLIFKSRDDHVLVIKNATYTYKKISSNRKEIIWLENSYHVATMDYDKDIIFKKSVEFIKKGSDHQ